jgi:hypothetical protein
MAALTHACCFERGPLHLPAGNAGPSGAITARFTQEPVAMGPVTTAVFDDTCGNLIQIATTT